MSYYSRSYYTGDGTTTDYNVDFDYLEQSHVLVKIDGVSNTDWIWLTASSIRFDAAPADGAVILIYRSTSPTTRIVDYQIPSSLNEEDLDNDSLQGFYLAQEATDIANSSIVLDDATGHYTAASKRITNVADPEDDQDVATKGWVEDLAVGDVASAIASAASAAASATAAAGSATSAASSASSASTSAATATTKASEASTSATNAAASATSAGNAKTAAETAQAAAETAKVAAQAAQTSAETALDTFDDRFLGTKSSDPTVDNDGNALVTGALYWSTTGTCLKIYDGSAWQIVPSSTTINASNLTSGTLPDARLPARLNEAELDARFGRRLLASSDSASGAWVEISDLSGAWFKLEIEFWAQPATDNQNFLMQVETDAAFANTSYQFIRLNTAVGSGTYSNNSSYSSSSITLSSGVGNASNRGVGGKVEIYNPSQNGITKPIFFHGPPLNESGVIVSDVGWGSYSGGSSPITGARFGFSSGNVAVMKYRVWGVQ